MKLSNVTAKLTFLKSNAVRVLAAATLAGAVLAATPAAQAQQFGIGVRIGGPRYYAPPPPPYYGHPVYPYGFYGYDHRDDWRFDRDRRFDDRHFDRDHRDFDDRHFDGDHRDRR